MTPTNPYESSETSSGQDNAGDASSDARTNNTFLTRFVEYVIVLLLIITVLGMFTAFVFGDQISLGR